MKELFLYLCNTGLDPMTMALLKNNFLTVSGGLAALKIIAKFTPGTTDDKIATLLANSFSSFASVFPSKKAKKQD